MEEFEQNTGKTRRDKDGQNRRGLNWIASGKFVKRQPTCFQIYISLYHNVIYTDGISLSVVLWP